MTITIKKGTQYSATITVTDSDDVAYDLTGLTIFFTVKYKTDNTATDSAALITKTITSHTTPASGISYISLTAAETLIAVGTYKWDIKVFETAGVNINTAEGVCEIVDVVTKRVE